ncbi:MAG: hypothetical protein Kow0056_08410 [Coriobacteriia bacterium]
MRNSDCGVQFLSIRYPERLAGADAVTSIGSKRDSYDNALSETINGLYKTQVTRRKAPWQCLEDVEFATLEWVHRFNNARLLESIRGIPPAEYEGLYWLGQAANDTVRLKESGLQWPGKFTRDVECPEHCVATS